MGHTSAGIPEPRSRGLTAENESAAAPRHAAPAWLRYVPYVLALFFALWSLRAVTANNIVDTDAARHAMNGVFLRDLLSSGQWLHPIEYGKYYYSRLPALSMPYHPPLFPAIEALFFWVFGVNLLAARLVVALAVAAGVLLYYRLITGTLGSHLVAACATVTFFFWKHYQPLASDIMLEFPAMAFALGALYCLRDFNKGYPLRRGLAFALLAGAGVWTKQHDVFLGMVPFLLAALLGRWRILLSKTIWISSVLFGVMVLALSLLATPFHGTGVNQAAPIDALGEIITHNLGFYIERLDARLGTIPAVFLLCSMVVVLAARRMRRSAPGLYLYCAWVVAAFLLLLLLGPYDERYLFFAMPALFVIGYAMLRRACGMLLGPGRAAIVPAAAALAACVVGLRVPPTFMRGPSESAASLAKGGPQRILYCGSTDGNFIFALRALDPQLRMTVISGDKLPESTLAPAALEKFAHRYGVNHIVVEHTRRAQPCDQLSGTLPPSMVLEREIPLTSSNPRWIGALRIYRFTHPSPRPEDTLRLRMPLISADMDVKF